MTCAMEVPNTFASETKIKVPLKTVQVIAAALPMFRRSNCFLRSFPLSSGSRNENAKSKPITTRALTN